MTYQSGFSLSIKSCGEFLREKNISGERQVYLPFNSEYSIYLKNKTFARAKVKVKIDGKYIHPKNESFVINANDNLNIERFLLDGDLEAGERFKFVNVHGSGEEPGERSNGLVEVEIQEEDVKPSFFSSLRRSDSDARRISINDHAYGSSFTCTNNFNPTYSSTLDIFDSSPQEMSQEGVTVGGAKSDQKFVNVEDFKVQRRKIKLAVRIKATKNATITEDKCPACYGEGIQTNWNGIREICPVCKGTGKKPAVLVR